MNGHVKDNKYGIKLQVCDVEENRPRFLMCSPRLNVVVIDGVKQQGQTFCKDQGSHQVVKLVNCYSRLPAARYSIC